ncbi:MAG: type I pullulanase [Corallococcus sp.]|nr:type I pullulanase [Corallococcus sp.]MCM1360093.1 type I pullulanase [Corallococcus sp.]MCM1395650.1 type I pullulanase [Corallococcus sp.]
MKKRLLLVFLALVLVLSLALAACNDDPDCIHDYRNGVCTKCGERDPNYTPPATSLPTDIPTQAATPTLQIHYYRDNPSDYLKWGFWIWMEGKEGKVYNLNYTDDFGGVALYPLSQIDSSLTTNGSLNLIPRLQDSWVKDLDVDRVLNLSEYEKDENNYIHVYIQQGDAKFYAAKEPIMFSVSAAFESETQITVKAKRPIKTVTLYEGTDVFATFNGNSATSVTYAIPAETTLRLEKGYKAEVEFDGFTETSQTNVNIQALYNTEMFNKAFYYDGELGAIYDETATVFRVWSPLSTQITLNVYVDGYLEETPVTYPMEKKDKGVFEVTVSGDLASRYYTYTVVNTSYTDGEEIVDPYAKSAGLNGVRGQVVDFSKTNPEGWEDVAPVAYNRNELVVWETHIADVTSSATWTGTAKNKRKFLGVIESGTTYTSGATTVKTGFDHIVELGVNAVQLLPIFDQDNNEALSTFNWGYNPLNYNVLEGSYSSNAQDGYVRIKEFKQLVQAFSGEQINVIMDVVYNHVSNAGGSNFDVLCPGYYFRYNADGSLSNGSGCGNETASERLMFRKFMIDSVCFWASEYKLGGFRFDLMGVHDIETMNLLVAALRQINPDIVVYGEPWTGGTAALSAYKQAKQSNVARFEGYGAFNDIMRDALIKGGMSGIAEKGWVTNAKTVTKTQVTSIVQGLQGKTGGYTADPDKTVNYVTCHDNYTLYDRIKAAGITDETTVRKMALLANSVVLTSNGTTFILAGEEFLRTKGGDHNSYQSGYAVNELDYGLKAANVKWFEVYKQLIEFKRTCGALHLSQADMANYCTVTKLGEGAAEGSVVKIVLKDVAANKTYTVIHANGVVPADFTVDLNGQTILVNTLRTTLALTENTPIKPYQTLITYAEGV